MSYESRLGPSLVGYNLTHSGYEYVQRILDLGMLEGELGHMKPTPAVAEIIKALHTVLAGGEVKIETVHRGNPDIVNELQERTEQMQYDANTINEKSGFYVTLTS
ncbi:hypothetical protein WME79_04060 [Sorangium sp. So ce726]|uniref:hypothetical protein n=1 Tax=Sorangium sp. So ce726 TaxID=3133319 RepID=UPI003F610DBC